VAITVVSDLRSLLGVARNQGRRPTCVAFAVSDAHAAARGAPEPLSPEHLYFHGVQRTSNGHPNLGVSLLKILDALRIDGQCAETGWPYLDTLPADLATWTPPSTATPAHRHDSEPTLPRVGAIIAQLNAGQPVVITLLLGMRFYTPIAGLVIAGANDANTDWHAVVAVAHGRQDTEDFILVRNSWGAGWGIEGHAWISASYLEPRLHQLALIS
jgi:Papain family cysteine protease